MQIESEATVLKFKISNAFVEWTAVFDSDQNEAMLQAGGMAVFCRGLNKEDPQRVIVISQEEESISLKMFAGHNAKAFSRVL